MNRMTRRVQGVSNTWICNAKKTNTNEPFGSSCILKENPSYSEGFPQQTEKYSSEELSQKGYVGIYSSHPEASLLCAECGEEIFTISVDDVVRIESGTYEAYHYNCCSSCEDDELIIPYILKKRAVMVPDEEEDGRGFEEICSKDE